eukprot:Em0005g514a
MGGTTGSAFCSQFLNLSQYKFHATAVTTNSITIPGDDAVPKSRGDLQEGQQQSSVGESPGSDLDECSEPPSKHAKHYIVGIGIPDCVCVQKYRLRADAGSQQQPSRTN